MAASLVAAVDPADRFPSLAVLLRSVERGDPARAVTMVRGEPDRTVDDSAEARVRWAVGDDYEILSKLGSGAFGTVWRARDLSLEREVALKALHPAIARDDKAVRAFWREAKLAAQLAHPAIVPIYDWDSSGDLSWYTMELAEEGSSPACSRGSGPTPAVEIATQVEQVLEGCPSRTRMEFCTAISSGEHPHRSLPRWRITDFGIATVTVKTSRARPARCFCAPEQLLASHRDLRRTIRHARRVFHV